ncbi:hypothetical protein Back11_11390 [Paenibacillus baekrokdamisoli]|uniref:Uncharacterized protein n=1 Tax=Paenibacillus baekrokdamisoli TaxID=1712516 RepID=A0A3G9J939_9BACL|nr:hypothetical protein [Paenibacillus baekrokdamisoli]MBB3070440.1 hypothetical protein [Paenibacillus baekrokdamisoli]BBH19794.1 hypothetical protein Back11_11390 [Paenibacillus baekrokdamisoli]
MTTVTQRIKELEHIRDWVHSHPEKVDPDVRPAAVDWLNGEIAGIQRKTTNRGRSRLAVRFKNISWAHCIIRARKAARQCLKALFQLS